MVMKKTKDEIIYDYGEDANSIYTETGNYIGDADDDDEFYTNGSEYVEVDKAHRLLDFNVIKAMFDADGDLKKEFLDWLGLDALKQELIEFCGQEEVIEYYLEYLWEIYEQ